MKGLALYYLLIIVLIIPFSKVKADTLCLLAMNQRFIKEEEGL